MRREQSRYDEPPVWAKDPFSPGQVYRCEACGAWEEAVKPYMTKPTCDCFRRDAPEVNARD